LFDFQEKLTLYYYYPRNVQQPERAMEAIGRHLLRLARS
jgi:hypothetical protein